jgi:hypothetical protein
VQTTPEFSHEINQSLLMKPIPHPLINLILNGMAAAVLCLLILCAANLAVSLLIRIRHEWHDKKTGKRQSHGKSHEKEDGL